ncbi:MAG TPA: fibronectin type III domain-containing protein [Bacteroidia bacterium]|nr:fibronectin type III domain-containing protein [Bacteroidia bacterium]
MKNIITLFAAVIITATAWSQNLKPVAQKVSEATNRNASFARTELFSVNSATSKQSNQMKSTVADATVLQFSSKDAQNIVSAKPAFLNFIIPTNSGNNIELQLYRSNIFTPDFTLVTSGNNGQPVPYSGGAHYWGIIKGDNSSLAAVSIFDNEVMGIISSTGEGNLVLGKIENDAAGNHILYNDRNLNAAPGTDCFTANDNETYDALDLQNSNKVLSNCIRLFWEVDFDIYTGKGSVANAANYVTAVFNQSAIIYANDAIPVELSEIFVWNTTDPYTSTSTSGLLGQFQTYRNTINGDLGHLLGYAGGGGIAAGFSGFCASNLNSSQCYSGVQSTYNNVPTYSWTVMVVTHEQGHLMGSRHTHACVWNGNNTAIDGCGPAAGYGYEGSCSGAPIPPTGGTIMSYCHLNGVGINFNNGFGPQPKAVIINNYNNAACLTSCIGTSCMPSANMSTASVLSTTATFNWAAVTGATSYNIRYRITGTSTWTTGTSATTSFNATGLTPGGNYEWQVQTVCSGGSSIFTISMTFITTPLNCVAPTNLSTTGITSSSATFNWSAASGATGYNVQYRIVGTSTWTTGSTSSTSFTASGLTSSSNYEWQAQTACSGGGTSSFSNSVNFSTSAPPCNFPQNIFTTNITSTSATFNWYLVSGAVSYSVRYRIVGTTPWTTQPASGTSYNATVLTPASNYEWQIMTICTGGQSSFSFSALFTTCGTQAATITAGGPTTFCSGGSVILSANTGAGFTYQWKKNGAVITGATASAYTAAVSGTYTVVITISGGCTSASNSIVVTVTIAQQYTWTQKANFGGGLRYAAFSFSIGTKGYAGLGVQWNAGAFVFGLTDVWEYESSTNVWTQKVNFPGVSRNAPTGFAIGSKGYVTTGWTASSQLNDTWEFDPVANTWTQKVNFGGSARYTATSFTIGNFAYVGTGYSPLTNDFWKYDPSNNTWTQIANVGGIPRQAASGFAIGSFGYVFAGAVQFGAQLNDLWQYNPATNTWAQKTSCPCTGRNGCTAFTINNKGYVGLGCNDSESFQDFYEYDPASDSWTQIPDFGGGTRLEVISFSAGNKGYVGTGSSAIYPNMDLKQDLWELTVSCPIQSSITPSGPVTFCQGGNVGLSVPNISCTAYQWKQNNVNISGATTSGYTASASGSYSVQVTNSCGSATSSSVTVTVNSLPTVSFSGLAASYNVSAPAATLTGSPSGGTFSGPGISGNTFTPSSAGVGGPYTIIYSYTNGNGCSNSSSQQTTVTNCTLPAKPGTISAVGGNTKVCPGDTKTYNISAVSGATSYSWTPPPGGVITNGQGTISVTVNYTANFIATDSIKVSAVNACGTGTYRALKITRNTPATPGVITGQNFGVCNLSSLPYSVVNVAGMAYNWSFSVTTASISGGQGTNAITAAYGSAYVTGSLRVTAANACGTSAQRSLTVKATPATPASISGPTFVCANQQGVPYSISPIATATSYTWSGMTGSHISDGVVTSSGSILTTTASSVTVNFGGTTGKLNVRANNPCGSGTYKFIVIGFNCRENENESLPDVTVFPNPTTGTFTIRFTNKPATPVKIEMTDIIGNVVESFETSDETIAIDKPALANGFYYLSAKFKEGMVVKKICITK